jgi:hypothetical protein
VGVAAEPISRPVGADVKFVFLGGPVNAFQAPPELVKFAENLPATVKTVAIFSTSALCRRTVYKKLRRVLAAKNIAVVEQSFWAPGEFKFMHRGRPDAADERRAGEWAKNVVK